MTPHFHIKFVLVLGSEVPPIFITNAIKSPLVKTFNSLCYFLIHTKLLWNREPRNMYVLLSRIGKSNSCVELGILIIVTYLPD